MPDMDLQKQRFSKVAASQLSADQHHPANAVRMIGEPTLTQRIQEFRNVTRMITGIRRSSNTEIGEGSLQGQLDALHERVALVEARQANADARIQQLETQRRNLARILATILVQQGELSDLDLENSEAVLTAVDDYTMHM